MCKINSKSKNDKVNDATNEPADFERAITSTGFGLFNIVLVLVALPCCMSTVFETSTMSYILPSAECDLKLTLFHKGVLNAITYAGMISSAILWGYAADTFGRRKLLMYGYQANVICSIGLFLSQNIYMLIIFKFFGGFIMCGPFAVLMSYVTEFHGTKYRSRIMMVIGMFFSIATLCLPLLAWAILPKDWNFNFFNNYLIIHSWHIFLGVCGLPNLIGGIALLFFPESPKFLMSQGRNTEALEVFKWIFVLNTKKLPEEYPVKELAQEVPQKIISYERNLNNIENKGENNNNYRGNEEIPSLAEDLMNGLRQLRPMFHKPYLGHTIHVYTIQIFILMGQNTLRLWLPQLFTSIANYNEMVSNLPVNESNQTHNLCTMLEYGVNVTREHSSTTNPSECIVKISDEMYMNTVTVGLVGIFGYLIAGTLINALGHKWILIFSLFTSGSCGLALYWAKNSLTTLILTSTYVTVGSISTTAIVGVIVNLFPTSLRTMIISLAMMFGRSGALAGNLIFPVFMSLGCEPPFLLVGSVMLMGCLLCCLLPQTHKNDLK